ncbi:calcium-binding protein [Sphingomonas arenae]|uniref:calcium-binding protein n=1 Tax=Sphingomonas arenae TaxID=2812555 RepID=UPI0019677C40|nr:calcium-binding protein [Sphingomonas arenae]
MTDIRGTIARDVLRGTSLDDRLFGYGGADTLYGYGGNDLLNGGTGADMLVGGVGDDIYYVDSILDVVNERAGEGLDTVRASTSYAILPGSSVERLTTTNSLGTTAIDLSGNELANSIRGNAGSNSLNGHGGNDTLAGLAGDDLLVGGAGRDRLVGGDGADAFVFTDLSRDRIDDFETGIDVIDLGWLISYDGFDFLGASAFTAVAGQGRFADGLFQLDLNGDAVADLTVTIVGELSAADFDFAARGYWDY